MTDFNLFMTLFITDISTFLMSEPIIYIVMIAIIIMLVRVLQVFMFGRIKP